MRLQPAAGSSASRRNPGNHAGQWLRRYKDLPPEQQEKALENDPQFRSLPPARQQLLRQRLQRFSSLPPQQQDLILQRMETWEHLTPDQKQQARQLFRSFRSFRTTGGKNCGRHSRPALHAAGAASADHRIRPLQEPVFAPGA